MTAVQVLDIEEEPAPLRIVQPERDPDIAGSIGNEASGGEDIGGRTVDIGIQFLRPAFPPPAPVHPENAVFEVVPRYAPAVPVDDGDLEDMVLVRLQRALRHFQADIGAVRGIRQGDGDETGVAARFFDRADDGGGQHAGRIGGFRQVDAQPGRSLAVETGVDQPGAAGTEGFGRIEETVAFEALEPGPGRRQCHFRLDGQAGCRRSGQPGRIDGSLGPGAALEDFRSHVQVDFQPVGLDALNPDRFVEGGSADFDVGIPEAGRIFWQGRQGEGVETVGRGPALAAVELSLRGVEFEGGGVVLRQAGSLVLQDHGQVQGVTGAPDAPFAVDETFQSFFDLPAADVKAAEALFVAVGHLEPGGCLTAPGDDGEGLALQGEGDVAVGAGLAGTDRTELEVVGFDVRAGQGLRRVQVGCRDPEFVTTGVFGEEADVGGHQVDGREPFSQHVIGRMGGVVPFPPVVQVPVDKVVVPVVGVGHVPYGRLFFCRLAFVEAEHVAGGRDVAECIVHPERQADPVDGTGLPAEESAQVCAPVLPDRQVAVGVFVQPDVLAVDQPAGTAELFFSAQFIVLQEGQDVVLVDADDPQVDAPQADGPEGEDQVLVVRQDVPLQRDGDGRFLRLVADGLLERRVQRLSVRAAHAGVHGQPQVFPARFGIEDLDQVAVGLEVGAGGAVQLDDSLGNGCDRFAELDLNIGILPGDVPGLQDAESTLGGNVHGERVRDLESGTGFLQADLECLVLAVPGDAADAERIVGLAGAVADADPGRSVRSGDPDHAPDLVRFQRGAEPDGSFHGGGVRFQQGAVRCQAGLAAGHGEPEGELAVFPVTDREGGAQGEGGFVSLSRNEGVLVRDEFDEVVRDPPDAAGEGRAESEQAFLRTGFRRPGQLDPDGASFRKGAAGESGDIFHVGGVREDFFPAAASGEEENGKGNDEDTGYCFLHAESGFLFHLSKVAILWRSRLSFLEKMPSAALSTMFRAILSVRAIGTAVDELSVPSGA